MKAIPIALVGVLACLLDWTGAFADEAQPKVDAATWKQRDVESKWLVYRRATRAAKDKSKWWTFLARNKDFELLETIAVYEQWSGPGQLLLEKGAPQGIRAAVWALWDVSSHSFEHAAVGVLKKRPAKTLGWLDKYMGPKTKLGAAVPVATLRAELEKLKITAEDPGDALPPLDPDEVFRHLDAPTWVLLVGSTVPTRLRTDAVYEHQVLRALRSYGHSGRHTERNWSRLEKLLHHTNGNIRRQTCLTYSAHPSALPYRTLLRMIEDEEETDAVREAAVMAFSKLGNLPVRTVLIEIATQTDHPAWRAAVSRLIDTREDFLFEPLGLLMAQTDDAATKSFLVDQIARLAPQVQSGVVFARDVERRLALAAWLQLTGHDMAANYAQWTLARFKKFEGTPKVRAALRQVFKKFDAQPWIGDQPVLRGGEGITPTPETITKLVRSQAERLIKSGVAVPK